MRSKRGLGVTPSGGVGAKPLLPELLKETLNASPPTDITVELTRDYATPCHMPERSASRLKEECDRRECDGWT